MFRLANMDVGLTPPIKYKPVTAGEAVVLGEALVVTAGALTKCGPTVKPQYVAVGPNNAAGEVPVVQVQDYMTFETQLSAAGTELKIGDKLTLAADGLRVTATTTGGVAEIVRLDGKIAGDCVLVKF